MNDQLEANKSIVREWHDLAIDQRKPEEAVAKYLGPNYRQHNPGAGDGPEPFIAAVKGLTKIFPELRMEPKRIIAEGDYVVLHSHLILKPSTVVRRSWISSVLKTARSLSIGMSCKKFPKRLRITIQCSNFGY
jgi:predicted SnoaL-like aldol condensation-catalyzing enzyme